MMQDIHEIRGPVMVGLDPALVRTAAYAGAGLLLVLILILVIRYLLKKRRGDAAPDPSFTISPYEQACRSLDRISQGSFHDSKVFYFDLGHTVKAFLAGRLKVHCLEMTTQELARALKDASLPRPLRQSLLDFQEVCDPFRYAPLTPDRSQMIKDLDQARTLVDALEKTTGPESEESSAASPSGAGPASPESRQALPAPAGKTD